MKIAVISIGNELLNGSTDDTNSRYISEQLFDLGIEVSQITTISDHLDQLIPALEDVIDKFDIIISTGGLGPTIDDRTIEAFSKSIGTEMVFSNDIQKYIKDLFNKKGLEYRKQHDKQCYILNGSQPLENSIGSAWGFYFNKAQKHIFATPGVPKEMKLIFKNDIKPIIEKLYKERKNIRYLKLFGIYESETEELIQSIYKKFPDIEFDYVLKCPEILLKIVGKDKERVELAFEDVKNILKPYIFATEDITLPEALHRELINSNYTLAGAESCTGGLVAKTLTDMSGASKYFRYTVVSYSNIAKEKILHVPSEIIEKKGEVSKATVVMMLDGLEYLFPTSLAYAVSGFAGPDGGTEKEPVGTVYIGIMLHGQRDVKRYNFSGDREKVRNMAAWTIFKDLYDRVKKGSF